jgi:hypothetical protein
VPREGLATDAALEENMADDDARARRTTKATTGRAANKVVKKSGAGAPVTKQAPVPRKAAPQKAVKKTAAAKKVSTAADRRATLAPRKKKAPPLRLAAEQTFDDDWQEPEPHPVREDPSARIRAVLRAAAQSLESADTPAPAVTAPPPAPDEPTTRVLVSPVPAEEEEWGADEMEMEEELEAEGEVAEAEEDLDEDEWAPPEVLDDTATMAVPAASPEERTEPPPPSRPPLPPTGVITAPPEPAPEKPEKKPRRGLRRLLLAILVIAVVAVAGIVGYSLLRDEGVDYSKLKVGECFDSSPSNEVRGVKVKDCSEPHNSEIFFLVTHPAGPDEPYPGKEVLVQFAADACLGQPLTDYLGVPLEQSSLKDFEIVPQESAWEDGRRVLVCGIDTGGEGKITGSVKGTRR